MKTTFTKKIYWTKYNLTYPELSDVIQAIRTGNIKLHDNEYGRYTLQQAIKKIRSVDERDMRKWKARLLPAVCYNGEFKELSSGGLVRYSRVTALDFDHIATPDEMEHLRNRLIMTPCVLSVFVTPSGRGLKALVLHDNTDPSRHGDLYEQLLDKFYVANRNDAGCKDPARRNYLSCDPDIWVNSNPVAFHYIPATKSIINPIQPFCNNGKKISDKSIICIMNSVWKKRNPEYWREGNRASSIFKLACLMCKWGIDENLAIAYFIDGWADDTMSEEEIQSHVENAYKSEEQSFGTLEFRVY